MKDEEPKNKAEAEERDLDLSKDEMDSISGGARLVDAEIAGIEEDVELIRKF